MGLSVTAGGGANLGRNRYNPWSGQGYENAVGGSRYRGSSAAFVASTNSFNFTIPTTVGGNNYALKPGDVAILAVSQMNNLSGNPFTFPAGWTYVVNYGTSYTYITAYFKVLTAADIGATHTLSSTQTAPMLYGLYYYESPTDSAGLAYNAYVNGAGRSTSATAATSINVGPWTYTSPHAYRHELSIAVFASNTSAALSVTTTQIPTSNSAAPYAPPESTSGPLASTTSGTVTNSAIALTEAIVGFQRFNGTAPATNWLATFNPGYQYYSMATVNVAWSAPHIVTGQHTQLRYSDWTEYYKKVPFNVNRLEIFIRPPDVGGPANGAGVTNRNWYIQFAKGKAGEEVPIGTLHFHEGSANGFQVRDAPFLLDVALNENDRLSFRVNTDTSGNVNAYLLLVQLVGA